VFISDTSSTTGGGLSNVTHASSGLVLEYRRQNQSTWTSVTPVSKTLGTYVSGGIVSDGSLAGAYEVDFPDAAFASAAGVEWVALRIRGVANMLPVLIEIELDAVDYQDAAAFGLSRIDQTIGSRSTLTAGGVRTELATELARIDATTSSRMASYTQPTGFLAATFPATLASPTNITAATGIVLAGVTHTGAVIPTVTDVTNKTGYTAAVSDKTGFSLLAGTGLGNQTANLTGNLTGSVGSISGVTFPSNFGSMVINAGSGHVAVVVHSVQAGAYTSAAFLPNWFTAAGLASDAVAEIADGVWDEATSGHTTAGTTGKALIDSGAAGNPWSTDLATGYTGTQAGNVLNQVKIKTDTITSNQTINVYPVSASTPERVAGTTITYYRNEIRSVSVVTDFTLTNLTLSLTIEDSEGTDLMTIANASISRLNQTFTVSIGTSVTASVGNKRWALRDITGGTNSVIARGVFSVQEAASA
jgi:hypothetical protein